MKLRNRAICGSVMLSVCLLQSANADIFDVNSTTAGFGVTNGSTYNWLDAAGYWADTTAVNDGTAATVAWQGTSGVNEQAYFIGSGTAGDNYTVRLGTDGSSSVFIQNIAINVLANGSAAAPSTLGNVTIGNVGDTGNLVIRAANSVGAQNGGTLTINNGVNMNAQVLNFRGGNVVINGSVSGGAGSNISSGGGAFALGGGTLTLAGNNSFSGNTSVASGYVFSLQHANALGNTGGTNTVSSGGTMEVANGVTIGTGESISIAGDGSSSFGALRAGTGGGTWSGGVTLTANARLGATASNTLTVTGSISGSFGLLISGQSGTGVVVLNPTTSNSYTGPTSIIRGILRLGKNDALNTGTTLDVDAIQSVTDAATFDMAGFNQTVAALQDSASTSVGGLITNSASSTTSTLTVNQSSNTAFDGIIQNGSGSVVLTKSGSGTLTLNAANTYTGGTNIRNGAIILGGGNNRLATTSSVSLGDVATSGKLVLGDATTARNQTLAGLTATGLGGNVVGAHATTNSVLTLSIASGTNTFAGVLGGSGTNENNLALIKNGAGTLALNSANSFIGGITLDQGTLNIGNAGALGTGSFTSATNINTLTNTSGSAITLSNSSFAINNSLIFGGSTSANNINTGSGAISLSGSERIVSVNSGVAVTFGGAVTGTNLRKDGLGTLVLAGANTGLGALRVTGGVTQLTGSTANTTTLILGHASSTGIGKFILGSENGAVNQTFASIQSTGTEQSSQSIVGGHSSLATLTINQSTSTTYAGTIGGAGTNENNLALTKTGSGTLVLSGANTYTGLTTVNGGELRISNASAIGGSNVTVSAGQLVLDGGITVTDKSLTTTGSGTNFFGGLQSNTGVNTWNGGVTLGADLSRMGARLGATLVIAGVIDDGVNNYSLVVRNGNTSNTNGGGNASTITEISGINTYRGNTQLIAGVTRLGGGDNRLPTGTIIQFGLAGANAKFDMNGFDQEVAGLAVTNTTNDASRDWNANELTNSSATLSTLTVNTATSQTFGLTTTSFSGSGNYSGIITGNIAFVKTGASSLTLSATNTFTGGTRVDAGILALTHATNTLSDAGAVNVNGGELSLAGNSDTVGAVTLTNGSITAIGSGTLTGSSYDVRSGMVSARLAGAEVALTKSTHGTVILSGANSYTGETTIEAGVLRGTVLGSLGAGRVVMTGGQLELAHSAGGSYGLGLTMSGSATIVSDRSDIGVGVSQQFTDLSMGENTLTLVKGSNVTSGAATLEILGNAVLTGNAVFDTQDGTELIIGGDVTGDYGLTKNGTGILTLAGLTGTNSYTGNTIINGGELHLTGQSSFASQTQVTIATGAFLRIGPNASVSNVVINSRPDGLLIEGTAQLDTVLNADGQLSQDLAKVQGSHTISENVVVSADDDYFGSAPGNATDDRIILESNATIRATKAFSMNANKGIRIASGLATFDTQENLELPNQIKGNGGLVKNGNAKLVIRGLNTYQGNTQVKQGRLEIATGGSLDASSAVTVDTGAEIIINGTIGGSLLVSSGATLSGSGTIEGSTTISGAHTPGNSPGIQTFASDLTYASGSTVTWELGGNTNQNSPVIYDQLVVNGNLNFSGATTMNLSFKFLNSAVDWNNGFWDSNQSWVVYDVTGSTTNFGNLSLNQQNWLDSNSIALNSARSNAFFTLTLSGNDILLNYTAVPETSVTLLGGLSALLMLRRRRAA